MARQFGQFTLLAFNGESAEAESFLLFVQRFLRLDEAGQLRVDEGFALREPALQLEALRATGGQRLVGFFTQLARLFIGCQAGIAAGDFGISPSLDKECLGFESLELLEIASFPPEQPIT